MTPTNYYNRIWVSVFSIKQYKKQQINMLFHTLQEQNQYHALFADFFCARFFICLGF
jgi:hypothetical protein